MSRRKKTIIWIVILLAVVASIYAFIQSKKPKTEYTTETAARGDLAQTVSVTGTVDSKNKADIGFKIAGKVASVYFDVGDRVKKGEIVARLDTSILSSEVKEAEQALEAQRQEYFHLRENRDDFSDEEIRSQRATVRQYEAALTTAKSQLFEAVLTSPIDGIVTSREINPGETVTAGLLVFTVMEQENLEIVADVPESDIAKVAVGQSATVTFDAFSSDEKFSAEVTKIDPSSTVIQDVVYYRVKLTAPNDTRIKPGMSNDVDINTAERKNVLSVPLRAVKTEGDREYAEVLMTQDGKNVVKKVYVETGLKGDEGLVEVTSGLSGGENVITFTKTQ